MLGLLEVVHDYRLEDADWVRAVLEASQPLLDIGCGVQGYLIDNRAPEQLAYAHPTLVGGTAAWRARWRQAWWEPFMESMEHGVRLSMHGMAVCSYASELWAGAVAAIDGYREILETRATTTHGSTLGSFAPAAVPPAGDELFYPDSFNVVAFEPGGMGFAIIANRPERASAPVSAATRGLWHSVARHLRVAANQRAAVSRAARLGRPRAFALEGQPWVEEAVAGVDAARGVALSREERDREWSRLVSGETKVLFSFERGGRRYLVVPDAPSHQRELPVLSARQTEVLRMLAVGLSNKEIAYELGVGVTTIAEHVNRLANKLGVEGRVRLVVEARRLVATGGV